MSDYTAALAKFLPAADKNFDWVQKEVHAEVQIATNDRQKPFFSEGSSAEIYFRPSPEIEAQERERVVLLGDAGDCPAEASRHAVVVRHRADGDYFGICSRSVTPRVCALVAG